MTTFITPAAAAADLDVDPATIHRAIRRGDLPAVRLGRNCTRIRVEDWQAYLNARSTVPSITGRRRRAS